MRKTNYKQGVRGFSLIEVNLAILIAALGLLMLFQLFPIGLRQSVQSESDLKQTTFANALFEEINANIRGNITLGGVNQILDDVLNWNDVHEFWKCATEGLGFPRNLTTLENFGQLAGIKSTNLRDDLQIRANNSLYFAVREERTETNTQRMQIPPQVLIRVREVSNNGGRLPNSYVVSVASTDAPFPAFLHNRQVYSREFYYQRRP